MKTLFFVGLLVVVMCTAASALTSYTNSTGGTVWQLDAPTGWAIVDGGNRPNIVLTGQGPDGGDAWYRGYTNPDDSTQAYWDFTGADLPNVGHDLIPGEYVYQAYVSDCGTLAHDTAFFGSRNGTAGYDVNDWGYFCSWGGVSQAVVGWTGQGWGTTNPYVWLSNTGQAKDMTIAAKWNPGWFTPFAVSGVRVSTDGNFAPVPEPSSLLALLAGFPVLALLRRKH